MLWVISPSQEYRRLPGASPDTAALGPIPLVVRDEPIAVPRIGATRGCVVDQVGAVRGRIVVERAVVGHPRQKVDTASTLVGTVSNDEVPLPLEPDTRRVALEGVSADEVATAIYPDSFIQDGHIIVDDEITHPGSSNAIALGSDLVGADAVPIAVPSDADRPHIDDLVVDKDTLIGVGPDAPDISDARDMVHLDLRVVDETDAEIAGIHGAVRDTDVLLATNRDDTVRSAADRVREGGSDSVRPSASGPQKVAPSLYRAKWSCDMARTPPDGTPE